MTKEIAQFDATLINFDHDQKFYIEETRLPNALRENVSSLAAQGKILDPTLNTWQSTYIHVVEHKISLEFNGQWRASASHPWVDAYGHSNELLDWFDPWAGRYGENVKLGRLHMLVQFKAFYRDSRGVEYFVWGTPRRLGRSNSFPNPATITLAPLSQWASGSAGPIQKLEMLAAPLDDKDARADNENHPNNPMTAILL